jgi:hypothetical protein
MTTARCTKSKSRTVPDLKKCLLSPQCWVQEERDNYPTPKGTWMKQDDEYYILIWGQAKYRKLLPYDPSSNVPIMYTAWPLHCVLIAFTTTFEALEANFFFREKVLQFPGCRLAINELSFAPEEFGQKKTPTITRMCQQVRESVRMTRR